MLNPHDILDRIYDNFGTCEPGTRYYDLELNKDIDIIRDNLRELEKLKLFTKTIKEVIELPMDDDIAFVDSQCNNCYKLRIKNLLKEEAFDFVKEVLSNV